MSVVSQYAKVQKQCNREYSLLLARLSMERSELETTITYDMDQQVARIFSAIRRDQTKIEKMGFKPVYGTAARGFGYEVPMSRLRWRVTTGVPSKRGYATRTPPELPCTAPTPDRKEEK